MKYAAISLNFDSLGQAYGWPEGYRDPFFFEVADRFFKLSEKYNFKYSIYIIGKDLENPENRARVRAWAAEGHEIGNHSWSHHMNLAAMPRAKIYEEVQRSHNLITETVGSPPRGFISPAWTTSRALYNVLNELNYQYDTSTFPSWLMFPAMMKNAINHRGSDKLLSIFHRKDFGTLIWGRRQVHRRGSVIVLPLPANRFRVALWHTLGFMIGWERHIQLLRACLREVEAFYYLIHPADLMDSHDMDPKRGKITFERLDGPLLDERKKYLTEALEIIMGSGRKIITMSELAQRHNAV